jgi:hypothetical protein
MKEWSTLRQICFAAMLLSIGTLIGINLRDSKPTKYYPIEVETYWHVGDHEGYVPMECDSVKGDTIYKDGLVIIEKNLTYIKFK